jgi:hypothetical protein
MKRREWILLQGRRVITMVEMEFKKSQPGEMKTLYKAGFFYAEYFRTIELNFLLQPSFPAVSPAILEPKRANIEDRIVLTTIQKVYLQIVVGFFNRLLSLAGHYKIPVQQQAVAARSNFKRQAFQREKTKKIGKFDAWKH